MAQKEPWNIAREEMQKKKAIWSESAQNACDGGGYRRLVFVERSEGHVVAAAGRYAECHRVQEAARAKTEKYEELLGTIEYLKTKQRGLVTAMERKNRMMKGIWEEFQTTFF